ncbi:Nicotinate-nucleotide diphosphorylase [Colletotrichum asianum]
MRMSLTIKTEAVTPPMLGRDETDGLASQMSGLDLDAFPTPPTFGKRHSMGSPTKVKFEKSFDLKSVFSGTGVDDYKNRLRRRPLRTKYSEVEGKGEHPEVIEKSPAPVAKSFDFSNFGREQSPQFELPARGPDQPPFPIPQRSTSKHNRVKSYSGGTFHFEECGEQVITPPAPELEGPSLAPPLACPYLKHDPKTYGQRRGCRGASFTSTHRLKEHLHRTHRQKPNCPRCRTTFSAEAEVREHLKSQSLCEVLEGVSVEGFDEVQEKQLKSKKRGRVVKSEQDKWREIYRILFPDSSEIPDPLYNLAFDDTTPTGAAQTDHQDAEAIFKQPVPRKLEEETLSLMEDAVGGQLNTKKRRKIMDVCKDFAIKMLRSPRKGKGSATRSKELARKATVTASPASPGSSPESSHRPRTSEAPGPMMMLSLDDTMETGSKAAPEAGLSTMDTHWALPEQGGFDMGQEFDFSDWPLWNQALAEGSSYGWSNNGMGSPYKMTFDRSPEDSDLHTRGNTLSTDGATNDPAGLRTSGLSV